jgi:UDP-glucose 4-epimerase
MNKVVGVVGNHGFIGKTLTNYLLRSDFKVVGFNDENKVLNEQGKLNKSIQNIDVLIWAATRVNPIVAENDQKLIESELSEWRDFLRLWEREKKEDAQIIFLSSGGCVYSGNELPFKENFPNEGINAYGRHKAEMEKVLVNLVSNWTILRLSNVYGPGQQPGRGQGVIAEWKKSLSELSSINVIGELNSFRDYLYIADACDAIILSLGPRSENKIFNVGSGERTSLQELLDIFTRITGGNFQIGELKSRPSDRNGYHLDISNFQKTFGWSPKITLEKGLRETLEK